jgi:hypothetical protein
MWVETCRYIPIVNLLMLCLLEINKLTHYMFSLQIIGDIYASNA